MIEIGSEFWDVDVLDTENGCFPKNVQWYIAGRSALQAIIKDLDGKKTVAMPSWCCDSMLRPFVDAGYRVDFYPVFFDGQQIRQEPRLESDVLFLMDYFGYSSDDTKKINHPCIIRDMTHSIFSSSDNNAHYYFGSLRKWCGVWTGGYAWTGDRHPLPTTESVCSDYVELRQKAMDLKRAFIESMETGEKGDVQKPFLKVFGQAEDMLETIGIASAAQRDIQVAARLDISTIKRKRRENAQELMGKLGEHLLFPNMSATDCPLFVPVCLANEKRDALRRKLIQERIYCPIHWPVSEYHRLDSCTRPLYEEELSLVCDQRYSVDDMERMIQVIKRFGV